MTYVKHSVPDFWGSRTEHTVSQFALEPRTQIDDNYNVYMYSNNSSLRNLEFLVIVH